MSGDNHPNPDGVLMDISRKGMDLAPRLFAALSSAPSTPEGWRELREAFEAARYVPGDHPIVPVKIDRFMKTVERILATTPAGDGDA
jgi:hypothetical protein